MSTTEAFNLIPTNQFMKEQPYSSQNLSDPTVQQTGAQFSVLNHRQSIEKINVHVLG